MKTILTAFACLLLLSCGDSSGSYDVFPMLVVTTPRAYSNSYSFQLLSRDGELTPIEIPDENERDYHFITPFSADGAAVVKLSGDEKRFYIVYRDGSEPVEIVTEDGSEINDCSAFSEGIAIVASRRQGVKTAINTKGEMLWSVDGEWSVLTPFVDGKAIVRYGDYKYGIINKKGEEMGTFHGDDDYDFEENAPRDWLRYGLFGKLEMSETHNYGVMNFDGEYVVEPEYPVKIRIEDKDRFVVWQDKKYGVIDREGNEILPFEYDAISIDGDMYLAYKKDMGYAWIDKNGEEVISPNVKSSYFYSYRNNLSKYRFCGSDYSFLDHGIIINREGEQVLEEQGSDLSYYFKSGGHYYFIGSEGHNKYKKFIMDEDGNEIYNNADEEVKIVDFGLGNVKKSFLNSEIDTWTRLQ